MRNGFALLSSIVLALIALTFVGVLLYMGSQSTRVSGLKREYSSAYEACRGIADYLITLMERGSLCDSLQDPAACDRPGIISNIPIGLGAYSELGHFQMEAELKHCIPEENGTCRDAERTDGARLYHVTVRAQGPQDRAEVEFVYRVYYR
ncbi:hypothetical protein [Thermovibrio sp.]